MSFPTSKFCMAGSTYLDQRRTNFTATWANNRCSTVRFPVTVLSIAEGGQVTCPSVTFEGVETDLQAPRLLGLGCDRAQGYLFASPLPVGDLPWLRSARSTWWG